MVSEFTTSNFLGGVVILVKPSTSGTSLFVPYAARIARDWLWVFSKRRFLSHAVAVKIDLMTNQPATMRPGASAELGQVAAYFLLNPVAKRPQAAILT